MGKPAFKPDTRLQVGDRVSLIGGYEDRTGRVVAIKGEKHTVLMDSGERVTKLKRDLIALPTEEEIYAKCRAEIHPQWDNEERHRIEAYRTTEATMPHVGERQIVLGRRARD